MSTIEDYLVKLSCQRPTSDINSDDLSHPVEIKLSLFRGCDFARPAAVEVMHPVRLDQVIQVCRQFTAASSAAQELPKQMSTIGKLLGGILFSSELGEAVRKSAISPNAFHGLRLGLIFESPILSQIPWEFAHLPLTIDTRQRDEQVVHSNGSEWALAIHPKILMYRRAPTLQSLAVEPEALRVLVAWANPVSSVTGSLNGIAKEVEAVKSTIQTATAGYDVDQIEVIADATPVSLKSAMDRIRPHIVHFIGHATCRPSGTSLVLQGALPNTESHLFADDLCEWNSLESTKLFFLSACATSLSSGNNRSLAESLSCAGIPIVVGSMGRLYDNRATHFARTFYSGLAHDATADSAIWHARTTLEHAGHEWGLPTLHLSVAPNTPFFPSFLKKQGGIPPRKPVRSGSPFTIPTSRDMHLTGRTDEISLIENMLVNSSCRAAVVGMGGVGKTSLAAEIAHRKREAFPGGIFWIDAGDEPGLVSAYAHFGRSYFGLAEAELASDTTCAEQFRDILQQMESPSLVILDNVTDTSILRFVPSNGECRVLVTSQLKDLVLHGFSTVVLDQLDSLSALKLLQCQQEAISESEIKAAKEIAEIVGFHPLALRLASHQINSPSGMTFCAYCNQLKLQFDYGYLGAVSKPLLVSYRGLSDDAKTVLVTAAWFAANDIDCTSLKAACPSLSPIAFHTSVNELVQRSLMKEYLKGTRSTFTADNSDLAYSLHVLVRTFGQLQDDNSFKCLKMACKSVLNQLQAHNSKKNWHGAALILEHARTIAESLRKHELVAEADGLQLHLAIAAAAGALGRSDFAVEHLDAAAKITAQTDGIHSLEFAAIRKEAAWHLQALDRTDQALEYMRGAFLTSKAVLGSQHSGMADYVKELGYILKMRGRLTSALILYHQALWLLRSTDTNQKENEIVCVNDIGMLHLRNGEAELALTFIDEAIAMEIQQHGDTEPLMGVLLNNRGQVLAALGRWGEVVDCHQAALTIFEKHFLGDHRDAATSHYYLGEANREMGNEREASEAYAKALPLYERIFGATSRRAETVRLRLDHID